MKAKAFCLILSLFMVACGLEKGSFRMEGAFKGFGQGELYVYTPDGDSRKLDTISVKNGKFVYQRPLDTTATFILVFPNYSEIPVIGASGKTVKIEGEVSHLKEIEVKGSEDNELMTKFRLKTSQMTPPEVVSEAAAFIKEHPASIVSTYLLNKHFILAQQQDYRLAFELAGIMQKAAPENKPLARLQRQLEGLQHLKDGNTLPKFTTIDFKGKPFSNADLYAKANVITLWASWSYESTNIQRQLKAMEREYGSDKLRILSFCLDASLKDCRNYMERDSITWCNVCDGRLWETPALAKLGLTRVPDNIITDSKGKIIAHSLPVNELRKKIEELINK